MLPPIRLLPWASNLIIFDAFFDGERYGNACWLTSGRDKLGSPLLARATMSGGNKVDESTEWEDEPTSPECLRARAARPDSAAEAPAPTSPPATQPPKAERQ
jgi:hypothetical protein